MRTLNDAKISEAEWWEPLELGLWVVVIIVGFVVTCEVVGEGVRVEEIGVVVTGFCPVELDVGSTNASCLMYFKPLAPALLLLLSVKKKTIISDTYF